jgi:NAD(P)-dependent dehydrogenase (short-subunit alcohol dehydrogenase family)
MLNSVEKNAVIIGSSGAIGKALVKTISTSSNYQKIYAFSRKSIKFESKNVYSHPINFHNIESIEKASEYVSKQDNIDLLIVATGILHDVDIKPEKSLRDISEEKLQKTFMINTIAPTLIAKYFFPLLRKDSQSIAAILSARVGSITDNRLGGWYSYRASKAALNMIIKNSAIEMTRRNKKSIIVGLHPGTVDSNLSKPFQRGVPNGKLFTPHFSATNLMSVLLNLNIEDTGKCFAWDGHEIPP